ncbi:MAG: ATP-binding protein [Bacteroidota bacterium]
MELATISSQIESFAQLLMDSNPQYIFWKDINSVYLGCNKLYAEFFDLEETRDIIGTTDYDYMTREEAAVCIAADREVMEKGSSVLNFEENVTDFLGRSRWFSINKIPLKDKAGKVLGVLSTMEDITEAKRDKELIQQQSQALEAHVKELETKNKELENFNYIVAHDLQEPIRNISNFASLLDRTQTYNKEFMGYILAGAERMSAQLDDLLQYYVMGRQDKEAEPANLWEIVNLAIGQQKTHIEASCAEVTVEDLPIVEGYKSELVSLFQNLISNAVKYRDTDRPCKVKVYVREKCAQRIQVAIEDNGVGMEPSQTELAKQIFKRLHNNPQIKGTGIGLAICTKVMQFHKGSLDIQSQPQEGTTIILTFPT